MEKIKILFYSHAIDYAGTWRSHERILLNLNKDYFDVYVFYNPNQKNNRLDFLNSKMDNNKIIPFIASKEKLGPREGYPYVSTNFDEIVKKFDFDILHFARSGYFEWPFNKRLCPIQIETNIFGGRDESEFLDYSVPICQTIANLRGRYDKVIYNPIPSSEKEENKNLKKELFVREDEIVFGRIGRADNFDSISFEALYLLKKLGYKFKYIIIGACNNAIKKINYLKLNNECIVLETTSDDDFIHKFHNTIDVFLHYRSDGECHSTAIAQAMSYGIPIVSHYAGFNGQSETINDGGFVASNKNSYCDYIIQLISDEIFYKKISDNAKKQSEKFNQEFIVKEWENVYKELMAKRIQK